MSELENLVAEFKKWRGNRSRCRYPANLWVKACKLAEHYPLLTIAKALEINAQSLKRQCQAKPISFAAVQVTAIPHPVKIEFPAMTIHFQANHDELTHVIQTLLKTKP